VDESPEDSHAIQPAQALERLGRAGEAREHYRRALGLTPLTRACDRRRLSRHFLFLEPDARTMSRNDELFARAQRTIPAGVNSPVRAFRSVGGTPRFFTRGEGAHLWDADGKRYIDYVGSWGPAILGHAHPEVVRAVQESARDGLSFGAPTEREVEMAETLCSLLPSLGLVRLPHSGTAATMSACASRAGIRRARRS
jgi:hypothetical protein